MEVFFDWELDEKLEQPLSSRKFVFEDLRTFIKSRYKVLEEQIDNLTTPDKPAFVAVITHDNGAIETKAFNIATHLLPKLKECITESDMNYIIDVIWQKVQEDKRKN
jgi:hypothetical protein